MEENKRVTFFRISEEISDSIEIAYQKIYDQKIENHQRTYIYGEIIKVFSQESEHLDKAIKAIKELNEYIKNDLCSDNLDKYTFERWREKAIEIEELVYTEKRESYKLAKDYIPKKAADYYDFNQREELIKKEIDGGRELHEKLALLFGPKWGTIIGSFNIGMYGMNQKETQKYLKENDVYYKKNRFTDIMSDELLSYKLAGMRQLGDDVMDLYYDEYGYLPAEEKDKYRKTGFYKEDSWEYKSMLVDAEMIGKAVKDTYYNKYYITPLEELKNSNVYGTQIEIKEVNKR